MFCVRSKYLLDLFLANVDIVSRVRVVDGFSDHKPVVVELKLNLPECVPTTRKLLLYERAKWKPFARFLDNHDWRSMLSAGDVDAAVDRVTSTIVSGISRYTPYREVVVNNRDHPWNH